MYVGKVAGIFHDASIGNAIHVLLVRLILLQGEEVKTLIVSFCRIYLSIIFVISIWVQSIHCWESIIANGSDGPELLSWCHVSDHQNNCHRTTTGTFIVIFVVPIWRVVVMVIPNTQKGLKIVHHADTTLTSFCAWQKNLNPQSDTHPAHYDLAVLVTRQDTHTHTKYRLRMESDVPNVPWLVFGLPGRTSVPEWTNPARP